MREQKNEGSAKQTEKERRRFYYIALGSQRELHCILELFEFTDVSDILTIWEPVSTN